MFWQAQKDLCGPPLHVGLGGVKLLVGLQVVLQHIVGRALAAPVTDLEILQISMTKKRRWMTGAVSHVGRPKLFLVKSRRNKEQNMKRCVGEGKRYF